MSKRKRKKKKINVNGKFIAFAYINSNRSNFSLSVSQTINTLVYADTRRCLQHVPLFMWLFSISWVLLVVVVAFYHISTVNDIHLYRTSKHIRITYTIYILWILFTVLYYYYRSDLLRYYFIWFILIELSVIWWLKW